MLFWSVPGLVKDVGVRRCEVGIEKGRDGLEGKSQQHAEKGGEKGVIVRGGQAGCDAHVLIGLLNFATEDFFKKPFLLMSW